MTVANHRQPVVGVLAQLVERLVRKKISLLGPVWPPLDWFPFLRFSPVFARTGVDSLPISLDQFGLIFHCRGGQTGWTIPDPETRGNLAVGNTSFSHLPYTTQISIYQRFTKTFSLTDRGEIRKLALIMKPKKQPEDAVDKPHASNRLPPSYCAPRMANSSHPVRMAYSVRETAHVLSVSEKSVRRLIDRNLLNPSQALRKILIPVTEVERFLRDTQVRRFSGED